MKKCVLFVIAIFCILTSCSKSEDILSSGTYVMEIEQEDITIVPTVSINTKQKEFSFSYDALSSYYTFGTYEMKDNILTTTTSDEKYHYVFEIVDENTLSFVEESSSEITVFDSRFSVVPQDGAIFKKIEE